MNKIKLIILLLISKFSFYSQSNKIIDSELIEFDKKVQLASMPFNNGMIHYNFDNTINENNHRYLSSYNYKKGDLVYKNQLYHDINQKYDLFQNKIIIEIESIPIELNLEDVTDFSFENYQFKRLLFNKNDKMKSGFYHLIKKDKSTELYVHYYKLRKEIVQDNKFRLEYFEYENFFIKKENQFYKFNNQQDIIETFPQKKAAIKEYFKLNYQLLQSNKIMFLTNLIQKLS